jgi:hypothetical protein
MAYHDLPNKARRAWAMTHPAGRTILPQAPAYQRAIDGVRAALERKEEA